MSHKLIKKALKGLLLESYPHVRVAMFLQGFRKAVTLKVISDPSVVAYTDHDSITISEDNSFFTNEELSFWDKKSVTHGLIAHETAHILYTYPRRNRPEIMNFTGKIEDKEGVAKLIPNTIAKMDGMGLSEKEQVAFLHVAMSEALQIENILEDGYIEPAWISEQGPYFREGLLRLREIQSEEFSWKGTVELYEQNQNPGVLFQLLKNSFLMYGKYNILPSKALYKSGSLLIEKFEEYREEVLETLAEGRSKLRNDLQFKFADKLLCDFSDLLVQKSQEAAEEQKALEALMEAIQEAIQEGSLLPSGGGKESEPAERGEEGEGFDFEGIELEGSDKESSEKASDDDSNDASGVGASETEASKNPLNESERLESLGKLLAGSSINDESIKDAEKAEEKAKAQETLECVDTEDLTVGIHSRVKTEVFAWEGREGIYQDFLNKHPEFKELVAKIRREVEQYLYRFNNQVEKRGAYSGSRMDRTAFTRRDKKYYARTIRPQNKPSIVASMMIDVSGSTGYRMNGAKLVEHEAFAALVLAELFSVLRIPFSVRTHSTGWGDEVRIGVAHLMDDKQCNFDNIASIEDGGANRDGFAMAYALKEIATRPEQKKLFFMISDGEPADTGYGFREGKADLQDVMKRHEKDVDIFAFGVGDSVGNLSEIYGDKYYDCSNPSDLSKHVVAIIKKALNVF